VTVKATVTKTWDTMTETTEDGCPATVRSVGKRTVTLRSRRATTVLVTFGQGRVSYSPAVVRFVAGELSQSGDRTISVHAPCTARVTHARCTRMSRPVSGASFKFFRSARNEISFHAARLPEFAPGCLREPSSVRAIRPSLQQAQGELSEAALANARIRSQTAIGSAEIETDLDSQTTGSVTERVSWELTFSRKR
jgi:hypothetical protein